MAENAEVTDWLERLEHPLKDTILAVRKAVLASDKRVEETIKWQSPTFVYKGNIASINPKSKKRVSLMFHKGAALPGKHPKLEGGAGTVKYLYFDDKKDVKEKQAAIKAAVKAWCAMVDA